MKTFPTAYQEILTLVHTIDPERYGRTRNFLDGAVTHLSPYISRGVLSTKIILNALLKRGFDLELAEKLIQELAWRDYWQQVWKEKMDGINVDLKQPQTNVAHYKVSTNLVLGETGIEAVDLAIKQFYKTGYLHNHMRMYIASLACNIGRNHWLVPAKWMYYHLLDADWGSNALSWQWVAGSNSKKKYFANQENINNYCYTDQKGTFLDRSYEELPLIGMPDALKETTKPLLKTVLPKAPPLKINIELPVLLYNFYNLDPLWKEHSEVNRVLLLEPAHFEHYPISNKSLDFALQLSQNISGIQLFVGSFEEFQRTYPVKQIYFKEHPLNQHYKGVEESRDWMFPISGAFPSFFGFWKKCKKTMKN